ncbi:hypothetical protein VTL71DRAFT_11772 [Oculimacula yallundae]|uniref:Uncharacterized protein n=1 Tax=Oculimacula yallundae TaxID=86028 RepID=A0ABR4CR33_9HELO
MHNLQRVIARLFLHAYDRPSTVPPNQPHISHAPALDARCCTTPHCAAGKQGPELPKTGAGTREAGTICNSTKPKPEPEFQNNHYTKKSNPKNLNLNFEQDS